VNAESPPPATPAVAASVSASAKNKKRSLTFGGLGCACYARPGPLSLRAGEGHSGSMDTALAFVGRYLDVPSSSRPFLRNSLGESPATRWNALEKPKVSWYPTVRAIASILASVRLKSSKDFWIRSSVRYSIGTIPTVRRKCVESHALDCPISYARSCSFQGHRKSSYMNCKHALCTRTIALT